MFQTLGKLRDPRVFVPPNQLLFRVIACYPRRVPCCRVKNLAPTTINHWPVVERVRRERREIEGEMRNR